MIFQTIISFLYNVATFLINLLPDPSSTDLSNLDAITAAINGLRSAVNGANLFFPVDDAFLILRLFIGIELALFSFRISRWVASIFSAGLIK